MSTHCFLHTEVLISKSLGDELINIFYDVTKMVNFIKQKLVHFRMFKRLKTLQRAHIYIVPNGNPVDE